MRGTTKEGRQKSPHCAYKLCMVTMMGADVFNRALTFSEISSRMRLRRPMPETSKARTVERGEGGVGVGGGEYYDLLSPMSCYWL